MEIAGRCLPLRASKMDLHGVEMGLIAGRALNLPAFDFGKALGLKKLPESGFDPVPRQKNWAAIGMAVRVPPPHRPILIGHIFLFSHGFLTDPGSLF